MSGDVRNSQAVRDAERASDELLHALRAGASLSEVRTLLAVKARADERVAALWRRVEPMKYLPRKRVPQRAPVAAELIQALPPET